MTKQKLYVRHRNTQEKPIVLYVVIIAHVSLWVAEKKREQKLYENQRRKLNRQRAWRVPKSGMFRSRSDDSDYIPDYFNCSNSSSDDDEDNQSLASYGWVLHCGLFYYFRFQTSQTGFEVLS